MPVRQLSDCFVIAVNSCNQAFQSSNTLLWSQPYVHWNLFHHSDVWTNLLGKSSKTAQFWYQCIWSSLLLWFRHANQQRLLLIMSCDMVMLRVVVNKWHVHFVSCKYTCRVLTPINVIQPIGLIVVTSLTQFLSTSFFAQESPCRWLLNPDFWNDSCITLHTVVPLRTLWLISAINITLFSNCSMDVTHPGHTSNLCWWTVIAWDGL